MIVNKYVNLSEGGYPLSEIDLFVLDRVLRVFKKYIPKEGYEKGQKWLGHKYLYRMEKKETEKYIREHWDADSLPLFSSIEIEVINRCNGECPFCPVNKYSDPRKLMKMDETLFHKIMDELGELNYSGRLALHSNNEPFLDSRIIEFARYAREKVPNAYIYMFTNGTLVTLNKFNEIIPYLDKMIIDNYDDELKLHENAKAIHELCRKNSRLDKKVEIHVRKIHEVLSTRGGQSPNNQKKKTLAMSCILPYKQMVVRPDGKTSLCCNDPYGKNTLADLNKMTLEEAWYSERYQSARKALRKGRTRVNLCRYCDTLADAKTY